MQDKVNLIRSLYVNSQSITPTSNTTFWWALQTQTEWVSHFWASQNTPFGIQAQNFENPIFTFECFSLKAVYNSSKLQRLLQVAKFLLIYSFTFTNIVFLFRHLPTETNVCYQMKCFSGDSFSFFYGQVLLIFRLLFWFHVKFKQSIQRH